jgi:hypothetical protein
MRGSAWIMRGSAWYSAWVMRGSGCAVMRGSACVVVPNPIKSDPQVTPTAELASQHPMHPMHRPSTFRRGGMGAVCGLRFVISN